MRGRIGTIYTILIIFIIFWMVIIDSCSLTNLDYRLAKLKYSNGIISEEKSFHGPNSAKLTVLEIDKFSRIYIEFEDSISLEDLNQLSMWILPLSADGEVIIEIYLQGYEEPLLAEKNLSELDPSQWSELDGFDLEYEGNESLDALKLIYGDIDIEKIWITLYKNRGDSDTIAFFDYINIDGDIISFEPLEDEEIKDGPSSASAGGLITYKITYGNNMLEPVDVLVLEDYDPQTIFISAYPPPDPGTHDTWTFHDLAPGEYGQITIKVRSVKPTAKASMSGSVSGEGFTKVEGMLSTERGSRSVTNTVSIFAGEFNYSQSVSTRIRPIIGSVLQYGEHGTGRYEAEEKLKYSQTSIYIDRSIQAIRSPARISLDNNRSMNLNGGWSGKLRAENDYRDIIWSDRYHEGKRLNLSYKASLGKSLTTLETSVRIEGLADRKALWPAGLMESRLSGDFNLTGKYRWRWSNKTIAPDKGWLECCPLEQE